MAMQNRLGQPANDFRYTLASGASGTLYGLQAEYVLLFINNPGCAMCREIREAITSSPMLSEMIERGRLKVLALYPDEDLTEWRDYRDHIPASWINAYDKGCVVREKSLYDLHAIPALYLLDRPQAGAGEGFDRRGADRRDNRPPGVRRLIDGIYGRWVTRRLLSCSALPGLKSRFWERTAVHTPPARFCGAAISAAYPAIRKDNRKPIRIPNGFAIFALQTEYNHTH